MTTEIQTKLSHYSDQARQYRSRLEDCILGALILEKESIPEVYEILNPKNFTGKNQAIFSTILMMQKDSHPVDILTVSHALRGTDVSAHDVVLLTTRVNSAANIIYHAAILLELCILENFLQAYSHHLGDKKAEAFGEDILQKLVTEKKPVQVIRDIVEYINQHIPESDLAEELRIFYTSMYERFSKIKHRQENRKIANG